MAVIEASGPDPWVQYGPSRHDRATLEALARYVRDVADMLRLRDWDISVSGSTTASDSSNAETWIRDNSTVAQIAFGPKFFDHDEFNRRATILHELLHIHVNPIARYARAIVRGELGNTGEAVFEASIETIEETTTDRLARALAVHFPPSPEP